jgi:hypothetical protein
VARVLPCETGMARNKKKLGLSFMKNLSLCAVLLWLSNNTIAQTSFPYDSLTHKVFYKQTYQLAAKAKADDVFALAETWFSEPARFTQKNAEPPIDTTKAKKNKNKISVDKEFDNAKPLQILDPAGHKINAMVLVKYYGGYTNSIKLLYIKYDINLEIRNNTCTVSIDNVRYYHFDPKSYAQTALYNFSGGKPCDAAGNMEYLIACENFHDEFKNLALYFNKQTTGLCADFKALLKKKMMLYDPKAANQAPASKKPPQKK